MKVNKLKKVLKESVREVIREEMKTIIKEAILADGTLSSVIAESVKGVSEAAGGRQRNLQESQGQSRQPQKQQQQQSTQRLNEKFKKMFDGADITEGTEPIQDTGGPPVNANSMPNLAQNAGISNNDGGSDQKIRQLEQQVKQAKGMGGNAQQQAAVMQNSAPQTRQGMTGQPGVSKMGGSKNKDPEDLGYVMDSPEARKQAQKEIQRDQSFINKLKKAKGESKQFQKKLAKKKMREMNN